MTDSKKIPAATIGDIGLSSIESQSPADASEIAHIGALLDFGKETSADLVRLCELLHKYGRIQKSEELLRCNVVDRGDEIHRAYMRIFGNSAADALDAAIESFASQFGVAIDLTNKSRFLKVDCVSHPTRLSACIDLRLRRFLAKECLISFRYDPQGCVADIGSEDPQLSDSYTICSFVDGNWQISDNLA